MKPALPASGPSWCRGQGPPLLLMWRRDSCIWRFLQGARPVPQRQVRCVQERATRAVRHKRRWGTRRALHQKHQLIPHFGLPSLDVRWQACTLSQTVPGEVGVKSLRHHFPLHPLPPLPLFTTVFPVGKHHQRAEGCSLPPSFISTITPYFQGHLRNRHS